MISATTAVNFALASIRIPLSELFSQAIPPYDVTVGRISYLFPNRLICGNLVLRESADSSPAGILEADRLVIRFNFWRFVLRREWTAAEIAFIHPRVRPSGFYAFWGKHGDRIIDAIRKMPSGKMKIRLHSLRIPPVTDDSSPTMLADLTVALKRGKMDGYGHVGLETKSLETGVARTEGRGFHKHLFQCVFRGSFGADFLAVDDLMVKGENFYSKLFGVIGEERLQVNGFAVTRLSPGNDPAGLPLSLRLRNYLRSRLEEEKTSGGVLDGNKPDISLKDLSLRINLAPGLWRLEGIVFNLNQMPVAIRGDIRWNEHPALRLQATVNPPPDTVQTKIKNFDRAELEIAGEWTREAFEAAGRVQAFFRNNTAAPIPLERLEMPFSGLRFSTDMQKRLRIALREGSLIWQLQEETHGLRLDDLTVVFHPIPGGFAMLEIRLPFYGGSLDGKAWLDTATLPVKVSASAALADVDANELDDLLVHFSKIYGRLFGKLSFRNSPDIELSGDIRIQNGHLKNFEFFKWVAANFGLPSLHDIHFIRAGSRFSVTLSSAGLNDILLESPDVDVHGGFVVDTHSMVSSKLSLAFHRVLLENSPKGRMMLRLADEGAASIPFDFRLSGNLHAMNFQWMESDFKKRIQDRIPDFIERKIERSIDQGLEGRP
ncbi:MAG: hypothetical protein Q8Q08_09810 [Candidatus Omnitrophota bacterium]|nr:hypothetical protein [Candidatus Omnitrophota bacterium]